MKVINATKNSLIVENLEVANTYFSRLKGLLGRKFIAAGTGLLIEPCNSIHMFFMRFSIDVLFIDKNNVVVYMVEGIKPWRATKLIGRAAKALELPEGTIKKHSIMTGDLLKFEE